MASADRLRGRVVVVTGAAGGIGAALARRFARGGAKVVLADLDAEGAEAGAEKLRADGAEALAVGCDVTDYAACEAAVDAATRAFGGVDVVLANAGITHLSRMEETDVSVYRKVIDVNVFGALHIVKAALPSLLERKGAVAVTSSIAGYSPLYGRTAYSASKYALHGLFETLRTEVRDRGVTVTMICPGFTESNIRRAALDAGGTAGAEDETTVGRVATADEVADAVFDAVAKRRRILILSPAGHAARFLMAVAPALYERLMVRNMDF